MAETLSTSRASSNLKRCGHLQQQITHSSDCLYTTSKQAFPSAGITLPIASTLVAVAMAPSQPREHPSGNAINLCKSAGPHTNV